MNEHRKHHDIDLISQLGWSGVMGNTDEMLWTPEALPELIASAPKLSGLLRVLFEAFAPATRALIDEHRMAWLRSLPTEFRHDNLVLLHASPGNLWRAPLDSSDDASLEKVYKDFGHQDRGLLPHPPAIHPPPGRLDDLQQRQRRRAVRWRPACVIPVDRQQSAGDLPG